MYDSTTGSETNKGDSISADLCPLGEVCALFLERAYCVCLPFFFISRMRSIFSPTVTKPAAGSKGLPRTRFFLGNEEERARQHDLLLLLDLAPRLIHVVGTYVSAAGKCTYKCERIVVVCLVRMMMAASGPRHKQRRGGGLPSTTWQGPPRHPYKDTQHSIAGKPEPFVVCTQWYYATAAAHVRSSDRQWTKYEPAEGHKAKADSGCAQAFIVS